MIQSHFPFIGVSVFDNNFVNHLFPGAMKKKPLQLVCFYLHHQYFERQNRKHD